MALTAILRKWASSLAPIAGRFVGRGGQRNYHASLFTAVSNHADLSRKTPPFVQFFSTAVADTKKPSSSDSLLQVIKSEIKIAQESEEHDQVEEVPEGFPFKIEDKEGQQTVLLMREYDGEQVKVEVHMPDLVTGEEGDQDDDDDSETPMRSSIQLVVTVTKKSGTSLEFSCVAYPDEISIDNLSVRRTDTDTYKDQFAYEGPCFHDLDENLKRAFHKYLEIRGIKPSTTNFLHEYMINKDSREFLRWLNNLKSFVEA